MDSFKSLSEIKVNGKSYTINRLDALKKAGFNDLEKIPYSIRILLENLLRTEDGKTVNKADIEALAAWKPGKKHDKEIAFTPARVVMQDFTGVPAIVDLAAMRDAIRVMGGNPAKINPLQPAELVIDHSVQVDSFGSSRALSENIELEYERNTERYQFLKWGQKSFKNFAVVPPGTGIVHQVNLEYLATVVFQKKDGAKTLAYPDTLVGTDSHTTMINGLGVLGWGVGGIEAEAAMLGQPISMLIPEVVGFKISGSLPEGTTATDLVLTVTQMLRKRGVVGKFVEFFGPGLDHLPLADRATIANMAPEYGATMGFFPVDNITLEYLRLSGRSDETVALTETYMKEQGLFRGHSAHEPAYGELLELDLSKVEASIAGPKRPQDRVALSGARKSFREALVLMKETEVAGLDPKHVKSWVAQESVFSGAELGGLASSVAVKSEEEAFELKNGSVVIAAITSCTNTSNPAVMIGAGLLAKKAVEKGLKTKPWVKTSLAPGSKVVVSYLKESGVLSYLEKLNFHVVGFGCTTCIGNSGPLPEAISKGIHEKNLVAAAVLSGNRNFEGRINPDVRANYLASPPLVVAYAIAGTMDTDLVNDPLGEDTQGNPVYLRDIWPSRKEVDEAMKVIQSGMFREQYSNVFEGEEEWKKLEFPVGDTFQWSEESTYVKHPPYFENMPAEPQQLKNIENARVLALLGDSVTTDHISPAGSIPEKSPAGQYLISKGVAKRDFNSYGARRGNHEVMVRGTFANIRLRNLLAPGTEGGMTRLLPEGRVTTIYDASVQYAARKVPLIILAGKEYGTGSSRDWAAKGPNLLGVKAVIAETYERIHRSNLIGMGILPLQYLEGQNAASLGLTGEEEFSIDGISENLKTGKVMTVTVKNAAGGQKFKAVCRLDTPVEIDYFRHGGILQYVLRQLVKN